MWQNTKHQKPKYAECLNSNTTDRMRERKMTGILLFLVIKVVDDSSGQLPSNAAFTRLIYASIMFFYEFCYSIFCLDWWLENILALLW